jgi:hypothetical protein
VKFTDKVSIAGTRKRDDGYLVVDARTARTGIQRYLGSEVGKPELPFVDVYRPDDQVFDDASMASFAHRPVTNDHPPEAVTADNWTKYAVGQSSDEIRRDGQYVRIPLMVADAKTIRDIEAGKNEISNGYTCDLDFTAGVTPDGVKYDAMQTNIRGNHIAIVKAGRAGKECRIGDGGSVQTWGLSPITTQTKDSKMDNLRNMMVDGLPVQTTDAGAIAIEKLTADRTKLTADLAALQTQLDAAKKEKEEEVAKKDAAIEDAKSKILDQAGIDKLVADRVALESVAKAIHKDVKTTGVNDNDLKKSVVLAKLGDDALKTADGKDETYVTAFVDARFATLAEDAAKNNDQFRDTVAGGVKTPVVDSQSEYDQRISDAWKKPRKAEG